MAENKIHYNGNSMSPTLRPGDMVSVGLYEDRRIGVGDVIAFCDPYSGKLTVHRIISIDPEGLRTKGDNNRAADHWVLGANEIMGRVVSVQRGEKRIRIYGGLPGRTYVLGLAAVKLINITFSSVLRPAYRWLASRGTLRHFFSPWIPIRVSHFKRLDGVELQLRWGKRTIGRLLPGQERWYIRRPFKLFVNEASLPGSIPDDLFSLQHTLHHSPEKQT